MVNDLDQIIKAAIEHVVPGENLGHYLPNKPKGRCVVVGAGKASAAMAAVIDKIWGDVDLSGVVATRYEHGIDAGRIQVIEAGHPVPDSQSEKAAKAMLNAVEGLTKEDLVLALISGGGSACCALPIDGLLLSQKQSLTQALLKSGASISEMNCVRKALSQIKGGQLAIAAAPASVHSLVISDIPGDDAKDVASGPTILSTDQSKQAIDIIKRYELDNNIIDLINKNPQPSQVTNQLISYDLVATPMGALKVAANVAAALGYNPIILSDEIEGESRELGKILSGITKSVIRHGRPIKGPAAIISGGETTVSIGDKKPGKGGRNTEFLLSFVIECMNDSLDISAAAVDSDGIDGSEDAAGARFTANTLLKAQKLGLKPMDFLDAHDSYSFFEATGDLIKTGPTYTNVNDIRVILVK